MEGSFFFDLSRGGVSQLSVYGICAVAELSQDARTLRGRMDALQSRLNWITTMKIAQELGRSNTGYLLWNC